MSEGDLSYFRSECARYSALVETLTQKIEDLQDFSNRWMEAAIALGSVDVRFDPMDPEAWARANMNGRYIKKSDAKKALSVLIRSMTPFSDKDKNPTAEEWITAIDKVLE